MRAIVYLFASDEGAFINLPADDIETTDDHILIKHGGKLVAIFAISEVRAAYLSSKLKGG